MQGSSQASVPASVRMYNAFARELVLLVKNRLPPNQKAALKKRFRLFDLNSRKHVDAFVAARRNAPDTVFDGVTGAQVDSVVAPAERPVAAAYIAGMRVSAALVDDDVADSVSGRIARAIVSRDVDAVQDIVCVDDELTQSLGAATAPAFDPPQRLIDDLTAIAAAAETAVVPTAGAAPGLGIVGLAEEISRDLDISSLISSGGGDASLATVIKHINDKVHGRIRDGSLDAARLCSEAQSILGQMPR